uniref:Uncharacterized protein n=1 Tax=Magallana gigas TaxID=29159 RepID=A0A8W8NZ44_MAGGI
MDIIWNALFFQRLLCLAIAYENIALNKQAWESTERIIFPGVLKTNMHLGYSEYAYNELCELEVFGCSKFGHYGENCSIPWYENCQPCLCDIETGTRLRNVEEYDGQQSNKSQKANLTWNKIPNTHLIPLGDPDGLSSVLYSFAPLFATLFVISIVFNIIFTIRECRNKVRFKDQKKSKAKNQQRMTADTDIHENIYENTEYQELTEVKTTENYIYDKIR